MFVQGYVFAFIVLNFICLAASRLLQSYGFSLWLTKGVCFVPEMLVLVAMVVAMAYAMVEHYVFLPLRILRGHEPGHPNYVLDVHVGELLALRAAGNGLDPLSGYVRQRFHLSVDRNELRAHLDVALLAALDEQIASRHRYGASWLELVTWLQREHGFSGTIGDLRRNLRRVNAVDVPASRARSVPRRNSRGERLISGTSARPLPGLPKR